MGAHINAARNSITKLMTELRTRIKAEVKVATITYTDKAVGEPSRFKTLPFSSNPETITNNIPTTCRYAYEKLEGTLSTRNFIYILVILYITISHALFFFVIVEGVTPRKM